MVGGGILGATTLWELAREGMEPLLLEAGRFGEASTGKSAAIVRCHYSNPEVVRMAVRSRERLRQLPLHLDCEPVYTRTGWLFLVDAESAEAAAENSLMQDEEGVDSVEVDDLRRVPARRERRRASRTRSSSRTPGSPIPSRRRLAYVDGRAPRRRAGVRGHAGRGDRGRRRPRSRRARRRRARRVRERRARGRARGRRSSRAGSGSSCRSRSRASRTSSSQTAPEPAVPCAVSSQADRVYMRPAPEFGDGHVLVGRGFPKEYERVDPDALRRRGRPAFEDDVRGASLTGCRTSPGCAPSAGASASTT